MSLTLLASSPKPHKKLPSQVTAKHRPTIAFDRTFSWMIPPLSFYFPMVFFVKTGAAKKSNIHFSTYSNGLSNNVGTKHRCPHIVSVDHDRSQRQYHCFGVNSDITATIMNQDTDNFLLKAVKMNFLERFALAWKILFSLNTDRRNSNANIAKQRLKMILFADRCMISDEAKQKIVSNIIKALSDFVEIESRDKVQLSVSTDIDLGTVYSVMVPVLRVKPGYQQSDEVFTGITGIEFKDRGEKSGCVDVKFDFYVPGEKQ